MDYDRKLPDVVAIRLEKCVAANKGEERALSFLRTLSGYDLVQVVGWVLECEKDDVAVPRDRISQLRLHGTSQADFKTLVPQIKKIFKTIRAIVAYNLTAFKSCAREAEQAAKVAKEDIPEEFSDCAFVYHTVDLSASAVKEDLLHCSNGGSMIEDSPALSVFAPVTIQPRKEKVGKKYFTPGGNFEQVLKQIDSDATSEDIFSGLFRLLRFQERHLETLMKRFMEGDKHVRDKDIIDATDAVRKIYDTIGKYQVAADMLVRATERINIQVGNVYQQYVQQLGVGSANELASVSSKLVGFMKKRATQVETPQGDIIEGECTHVGE